MASRLSSLLVRDGLVGVKRMEKAFQRQVIYGGSLDTILLEMGLVPDERLTQYLSLASGLPPASRDECNVFDAEAVRRVSEEIAHRYRIVPLALEGDALRILVCEPVDMEALEELADAVDLPIQPLIVPEYRWHVVYARAYGGQAPARFTTLAKQLESAPAIAPVGRARSVIIDEPAPSDLSNDHIVIDVKDAPTAPTGPMVSAPTPGPAAALAAVAHAAPLTPVGPEAVTTRFAAQPDPDAVPSPRTRTTEISVKAYQAELERVESQRREAEARRTRPPTPAVEPPPQQPPAIERSGEIKLPPVAIDSGPSDAVIRAPLSTGETPDVDAAISPIAAREALAVADSRDAIFGILLRALRSKARWAGLLTVQGGAVIGRLAVGEPGSDVTSIATVLIPLDGESAFRTAVTGQRAHVGPLATGDREVDSMIERLGGVVPPAALLLPIVLRDRVVALAVAHRLEAPLGLGDVAELLPLASAASDAIGRLIVKHKAAGYRAPTGPNAVVQVTAEDVDTKPHEKPKPASAWRIPTAQPMVPIVMDEPPRVSQRPAQELLDDIEHAPEGAVDALMSQAVERAGEILPLVAARFPGKLKVDRYAAPGRPLRAAQYGVLLDLLVRIGSPATEVLVDKMGDPHRDVRFYATVCCVELRPRSAVYALVERLFDSDYGVRGSAIEALNGYPLRDLDSALARARHALHSEDADRVLAAANAVAELADIHAIPDLIEAIGRGGKRGEHARRALIVLTRQDLGTSERKWRRWWDEHRTQHRIEWLIEALTAKEDALRSAAAEDLRRLTGEHFGYHHDQPKKDREASQARWRQWWNEVGRRRFARDDDEHKRPTAMLPQIKRE